MKKIVLIITDWNIGEKKKFLPFEEQQAKLPNVPVLREDLVVLRET